MSLSLTHWDADFTVPFSGAHSFLKQWINQYLSFIWCGWHLSQTKRLRGLGKKQPTKKKSKLWSGSGHVLRNDSHFLVYSMVYNMIFYPLSHLTVTAALESRCHYSYFTAEKGGAKVGQWTCMSHMRTRERNQPQDTLAMLLPPWVQEVRKMTAPQWNENRTTQPAHLSGLGKSD